MRNCNQLEQKVGCRMPEELTKSAVGCRMPEELTKSEVRAAMA